MLPSERAGVTVPLDEKVGPRFWAGLVALTRDFTDTGYFAFKAPHRCADDYNHPVCGTDTGRIGLDLFANVGVSFPLDHTIVPDSLTILDTAEFLQRYVGRPRQSEWHPWEKHTHFWDYDAAEGVADYSERINQLLSRCGHPYELRAGRIERKGPGPFATLLTHSAFHTGDAALDLLLVESLKKFGDPDPSVRREGLEKLWDAWQRLRSLEDPTELKRSAKKLIGLAEPDDSFATRLSDDALALNAIGNDFMIRHFETSKLPLHSDLSVDYLFHRMFALVYRLLKGTGRVS